MPDGVAFQNLVYQFNSKNVLQCTVIVYDMNHPWYIIVYRKLQCLSVCMRCIVGWSVALNLCPQCTNHLVSKFIIQFLFD